MAKETLTAFGRETFQTLRENKVKTLGLLATGGVLVEVLNHYGQWFRTNSLRPRPMPEETPVPEVQEDAEVTR